MNLAMLRFTFLPSMVTKCHSIWILEIIQCERTSDINSGHLSILKLLIQNKANVNIANENGNTALYYAVQSGKWRVSEILSESFKCNGIIRYFQIGITSLRRFLKMTQIKMSGIQLAKPRKILLQKKVSEVLKVRIREIKVFYLP